jgi:hypothetical protein
MSRAADYTIKGFLYQFNKTLLEILNSKDDSVIRVEGIVEDIEIVTPVVMTAIQCKYHEASEAFTPSGIFKPLLQMMDHFHANGTVNIRYVLFAHFPSVTEIPHPRVGMAELQTALDSKNKEFESYVESLRGKVDLTAFLARFTLQFGPTFDDLVAQVSAALKASGIPDGDINTLAYPNAINMVAGISVKHNPAERTTTKRQFLEALKTIRKTAISRWTMALHTRKELLDARRKQMKMHLDKNSRLRYFVVDALSLGDYESEIVLFVCDYLEKYHFKTAHICTPVLCLCTSEEVFLGIQYRLFVKGIVATDGYIGEHFDESWFFREPFSRKSTGGAIKREFSLRLLRWEDHGPILNTRKCDDLFIIGEPRCDSLTTVDVNVEHLAATSLKEVKYVLGVSNVYE